jgi:Ca2+-transporting ATPase
MPKIESFFWIKFPRQFEERNTIYLIWAATAYLGFSYFTSKPAAKEALMIFSGIWLAGFIQAICEYQKDNQWLGLKSEINNQEVVVFRGSGDARTVKVRDIVVGDVIQVTAGNRVPADCILTQEMNITVDQSIHTGETNYVPKSLSDPSGATDNHTLNPDPFLFADSKIISGQGRAIVCAVGRQTKLARSKKAGTFHMIEGKLTDLEKKLKMISTYIEDAAVIVLVACLVVQALFIICMALFGTDEKEGGLFSGSTLAHAVKACIVCIVLLIVIVPEGLALAVQMAMSLSIANLKDSKILVKNHESI